MDVSLPDSLRQFIELQVDQGGYGSASEYVRQLVHEDQRRAAQERLEQLLLEGVRSGPSREMTAEDWDDLQRRVAQRDGEGGSK